MNALLGAVVVNSTRDGHHVETFWVDESVESFVLHLSCVYGVARDVDVLLIEEARYGDRPYSMRLVHVGEGEPDE
jgi:hypothetical protein